MAYDLDDGWLWRLAGPNPWSEQYVQQLSRLMAQTNRDDVVEKQRAIPRLLPDFDRDRQVRRVTEFIGDILGDRSPVPARSDAPELDPVSVSA